MSRARARRARSRPSPGRSAIIRSRCQRDREAVADRLGVAGAGLVPGQVVGRARRSRTDRRAPRGLRRQASGSRTTIDALGIQLQPAPRLQSPDQPLDGLVRRHGHGPGADMTAVVDRQQGPAVGAERHGERRVPQHPGRADRHGGSHVPEVDRSVLASGREERAVGRERAVRPKRCSGGTVRRRRAGRWPTSQSRAALVPDRPKLTVRSSRPSGLKAIPRTYSAWRSGSPIGPARGDVDQPDRRVQRKRRRDDGRRG